MAEEGLLVCVGEVVMAEAGGPAEASLAHVADVRFFLAVFFQMSFQQEASLEGFAALLADEGAHVSVAGLPVDAEGIGSVGAILAFLTLIWLQACVLGHMIFQLVDPFALVATFWAQIVLFVFVYAHVIFEARRVCAGVSAEVTLVRFLPCVDSAVPGDLLLIPGAIFTIRALVKPCGPVALDMMVIH